VAQAFQWTPEELQDMVASYKQGESAHSIAKRYGTSYQVIQPVLTKQGVTLRSKREANKRQSCNDRYFQVIDTEEKTYWLGFLTADGCVTQGKKHGDSPRITIHLAKQDYGHLIKLKQALQATQMVSASEQSCSLTIFSKDMAADLATHGVLPKKTFSTKPTQVASELVRHYWRGVIDGDGWIQKNGTRLTLVGDYEVILGFQSFVLSHCPKVKACINRMDNIYQFVVTGKGAQKILELLYGDAMVYLERKNELAKQAYTFP
jgi:hypothetical protein